jgi:Flp pilus assembly protein TadG
VRIKRENGTAALELMLVAPALILLLGVVIGAGRVVSTKSAVLDVARESARAAADAPDPQSASAIAMARAREVAAGLGLDVTRLVVEEEAGTFGRGTPFTVTISYRVRLGDLPAFGLLPGSFVVTAHHTELTDRYRSR